MNLMDIKKENKSLSNVAFEKIREDILNDVYLNEDKICVAKLAEELSISRTPVREALRLLEMTGLVASIPDRSIIVKGITEQDIMDIYAIRIAIEGIAASWSVQRISDEEIANLKEVYEIMEFYTAKGDADKISELNTQFHEIIYRATGSRYMEYVLKVFQMFIKSTRSKSLKSKRRLEEALEEHKAVLDAFLTRDIGASTSTSLAHVYNTKRNQEFLLETFQHYPSF